MARKGEGGKLNRTEVTTVRFDPKLKLALELAARKQRRTISSFIEWAVEQATKKVTLFDPEELREDGDSPERWSAYHTSARIFHVNEVRTFCKKAFEVPHLLNFEEEEKWEIIKENDYFWDKPFKRKNSEKIIRPRDEDSIQIDKVSECWRMIESIIAGEKTEAELPNIDLSYLNEGG